MARSSGALQMIFSQKQANERPAERPPGTGSTKELTIVARAHRSARVIKWISAVLILIALFVLIHALPVARAIDLLESRVDSLGFWGPLALGVGLLAAIAVIVYVTRLPRQVLGGRTKIQDPVDAKHPAESSQKIPQCGITVTGPIRWPWGTTVLAVVSVAVLAIAAYAHQRREALKYIFGPPSVTLREAYQHRSDGRPDVSGSFDHSTFDGLLRKHVDQDGWVDYEGLRSDATLLDTYIASLGEARLADLGRNHRLALLINAYNAFTLRLILDHYPVKSIKDIPSDITPWDDVRWRLGPMTLSLNQMEHERIRPKFAEPRIHFALVCAAIGCPKLRNEAYQADRIEEQLDDQTRYVHGHHRWFQYQRGAKEVHLTKLYDWYGADFRQVAGSVLDFAARYSGSLKAALDEDEQPQIKWLDYDWTLNDRKNDR